MSETQDAQSPKQEPTPYVPGQPLPRLWKTEPEPEGDSDEAIEEPGKTKTKKKTKGSRDKDLAESAPRPPSKPKPKAPANKAAKPRKKPDNGPNGEKKALVEETPKLDTIESRQRVRMAVGGLMVFCMLILGRIVYGMIFQGSDELELNAVEMPPAAMNPLPAPALSREPEARYMLDRAREYAKREQTGPAIAMLDRIVSVYKGTAAAGEAQAALDRTRQKLPLFPERPYVLASKATATGAPAGATAPPPPTAGPGSSATGSPAAGSPAGPAPAPMPPSQVAKAGTASGPPAGAPGTVPPAGSQNPGTVGPIPPPGASPGPVASAPPPAQGPKPGPAGPPPASGPAMGPNVANNAPPPGQPGAGAAPPPPGPGEVATLIPGNGGNAAAMPPAGGNPDRGAAIPGRTTRMLPPGFKAKPEAGLHESGWPTVIVGERDGAIMVLVPGGTFTMGTDRGDPAAGPAHFVRLSTYYIDQHEVTNRQFRTFLDDTRYHGQPPGKWLTDPKLRAMPDDAPAVSVSYQDAEEYAIWALKRLPTEAQWEMAARSVDGRRYPWGDEPARWSRPRKYQQIDRVMSFPEDVSPYGVFDLAGNAVEWVRDWYDPAYYNRLRDKTTLDPTGPPGKRQGIQRVVKGYSKDWLMFTRQGMDSDRRLPYLGFRCSLAVEGGEASAVITPHPPKPTSPQPGNPAPGQGGGNEVPF